jgi:hypothetical protein
MAGRSKSQPQLIFSAAFAVIFEANVSLMSYSDSLLEGYTRFFMSGPAALWVSARGQVNGSTSQTF